MVATPAPVADLAAPEIPVRTLSSRDLNLSLREGWNDFLSMRGDLIFVGALYPLIGFVAAWVALGYDLLPLFFPIAAGISLLGPKIPMTGVPTAADRCAGPVLATTVTCARSSTDANCATSKVPARSWIVPT